MRYTSVPYEIILVDNASTECDPQLFLDAFPSIKLIKNVENSGFARGNNLGIAKAKGDMILLLNSDTYFTEDAIGKTLSYYNQLANPGVVGCGMIYTDGRLQYPARRFKSIRWELLDVLRPLLFCLSYTKRANLMLGKYFKSDFNTKADWLNGAFFMFSRNILESLHGNQLDDRFFMYGEDHLWCWQIQMLGYNNYFYSGTTIVHISSGSTSLSKQLHLRNIMLRHELEIMKLRKGTGLYFYIFKALYGAKETCRNLIKMIIFRMTGNLMR